MQFEYDPERFIKEVKKRPGIWDFDHTDYKTRTIRVKLWGEIVKELMDSSVNVNLSKSDMRELELQLQKKWKSMRDCFHKYIANPNRTRRPYIYCKQLQFLLKNEDEPQNGNSSDSDNDKHKSRLWKTKRKLRVGRDEQTSDEDDNGKFVVELVDDRSDVAEDVITPAKIAKTNKSVVDDFAFANVDAQKTSDTEDPDKLFMLSLVPHLKSIPEHLRLNVKMDLMQVLRNANYNSPIDQKIF